MAFGDSFTANSHRLVNKHPGLGSSYPKQSDCFVAADAWPGFVANQTGRPVQNWACNTHTTANMLGRVDQAIRAGHVNDTSTVVFAAGMNDKNQGVDDAVVRANLVAAVDKVRAVAPKVEVLILGRLATTGSSQVYCDVNIIPNMPTGQPAPRTASNERATQANQKAAAASAGVPFIDIRSKTIDSHSSCAKDAARYISGNWDITTRGFNMTSHPSTPGSRFLASQVAAASAR